MNPGRGYALLGGIFSFVGVILLVVGVVFGFSTWSWLKAADRVDGTVVELIGSRDSDGGRTYRPVVEYTVDGTTYTHRSGSGTNPPAYDEGERVEVAYDPENPGDAKLPGFSAYLVSVVTLPLGLVFASVGSVFLVIGVRRLRRRGRLLREGQQAAGRVVSVHRGRGGVKVNGRSALVITVAWFDPVTGTERTTEDRRFSTDLNEGDSVYVRFDPADPEQSAVEL